MGQHPSLGVVHSLAGAALALAYGAGTISSFIGDTNGKTMRFRAYLTRDAASTLTGIKVKLKGALTDVAAEYQDIPSTLDAAPAVFEIEHALNVSAGATGYIDFHVDMSAWGCFKLDVKSVGAGGSLTDALTISARIA